MESRGLVDCIPRPCEASPRCLAVPEELQEPKPWRRLLLVHASDDAVLQRGQVKLLTILDPLKMIELTQGGLVCLDMFGMRADKASSFDGCGAGWPYAIHLHAH